MSFAEIDLGALFEVVWVSLLAGVGVTAMFSLVVYGGARAGEARRAQRSGEATAFFVLSTLAFVVFLVGVVLGVGIMLNK
jgi:hypothetical protein